MLLHDERFQKVRSTYVERSICLSYLWEVGAAVYVGDPTQPVTEEKYGH